MIFIRFLNGTSREWKQPTWRITFCVRQFLVYSQKRSIILRAYSFNENTLYDVLEAFYKIKIMFSYLYQRLHKQRKGLRFFYYYAKYNWRTEKQGVLIKFYFRCKLNKAGLIMEHEIREVGIINSIKFWFKS